MLAQSEQACKVFCCSSPSAPFSVAPLLGQWGYGEGQGTLVAYFADEKPGPRDLTLPQPAWRPGFLQVFL